MSGGKPLGLKIELGRRVCKLLVIGASLIVIGASLNQALKMGIPFST
jgi:hypothetical protein